MRNLYSRLVQLAAAVIAGHDFISPDVDDNPKSTPRAILDQAEKQKERLRVWAIEIREVADALIAATAAPVEQNPSDAAMRAAKNAVEELKRDYLLADPTPEELNEIAAIITRHLAVTTSEGDKVPSTQEQFQWTMNHLLYELAAYLDTLAITSDNIGDIRRALFVPWESRWNGIVREQTAERELSSDAAASTSPETPVGGARKCVKCGHNGEYLDKGGRCWAIKGDDHCLCKCSFAAAPVVSDGDDEGAVADGRYCRHHDDDPAHGKICYDKAVYEGAK